MAQIPADTLRLDQFLSEVKAKNPKVLAVKKKWEAAAAKVLPAKTWDNPTVGLNLWRIPSGQTPTPGNARMDMYVFEQKIPFPGKLSARGEAARHAALGFRREHEAVERRVLSQAAGAYYDLWHLREQVRLHGAHAKLWERFASVSERLYAAGKVTQRDVLLAQVELDKSTNEAANFQEKLPAATADFNALANQDASKPVGRLSGPTLDADFPGIEELQRKALEHNQELLAAEHHVRHRRFALKQSRLDYLPDFTAGVARMQESNGFSGYNAKLFLSIPLYFWKQKSMVKSAESSLEEMERRYEAVRNQVGVDLRDALSDLRNSARTAKLYESSILPRTQNALRVVESGYLSGKIGFLDLLDVERRLLLEELRYFQALKRYGAALAELERALGLDLMAFGAAPQAPQVP
ncbi:MAG: TolC family protein [Acidobacteria bacterium]|nr:TolC family protein [Acidobacteriota bacterium]